MFVRIVEMLQEQLLRGWIHVQHYLYEKQICEGGQSGFVDNYCQNGLVVFLL